MNLVDTLKRWGLTVVEVDGWQTRGWTVNRFGQKFAPRGLVCHHTANGGFHGIDAPSLNICINGRPDLAGPLCQFVLGYSGTVYLIAGLGANHAGAGGWGALQGNGSVWGVEAENNGVGEPWPQVQLDAYHHLAAALAEYTGFAPGSICGHKEWTPQKIDPAGIDMNDFRRQVAALLETGPPNTNQSEEDDDMAKPAVLLRHKDGSIYTCPNNGENGIAVRLANDAEVQTAKFFGAVDKTTIDGTALLSIMNKVES